LIARKGNKLTRKFLAIIPLALLVLAGAPRLVSAAPPNYASIFRVHQQNALLEPSFDPLTVGGAPFCSSGSLGTILCYPPSFLKKAYNFPSGGEGNGPTGTGQKIVIVDAFGSPTVQSDLDKFDKTFNIPGAKVTVLCPPTWSGASTDACPPTTPGSPIDNLCGELGWAEETTLDVTMSHALAPGAQIFLVVAQDCFDTSFNAAELAVVAQEKFQGSIMSQSFGEPDDLVGCLTIDPVTLQCTSTDPSIKADADAIYALAKQNQWTVIASSGDDGANTNARVLGTAELTPSWPSSSPLNLAAGGTQGLPYGGQYGPPPGPGGSFTCAAHATCNTGLVLISGGSKGCQTSVRPAVPSGCTPTGYGGEGTWNEFTTFGLGTSSGGGVSVLYDRPSYQDGLPKAFTTLLGDRVAASGRLTPDVSFNSAINGGVLAYLGMFHLFGGVDRWAVFGGTSASSPAWASIIALVNEANGGQPVGFINPAIYNLAGSSASVHSFHDITSGDNSDTAGQFGVDGFKASSGYDLTTGWGTPNVAHFITDLLCQVNQGDQNGRSCQVNGNGQG
jgi:subtilase family serine protease